MECLPKSPNITNQEEGIKKVTEANPALGAPSMTEARPIGFVGALGAKAGA